MSLRTIASQSLQDYTPGIGNELITYTNKDPARAATTAALAANTYSATTLTLTANSNGALGAIDGVTLAVGDVLLVKNEGTGANNGLYSVTSLGGASAKYVLTRTADLQGTPQALSGINIFVSEGTANGGKFWTLTTANPITLGTTALTFIQASVNDLAGVAVTSPTAAGQALVSTSTTTSTWAPMAYYPVRGVVTANIASLAAFTVASNDGLTYAAGQFVLLVNQTTASQNGPYVVGTVATGTAPLTRPAWWATGEVINSPTVFVASEGTQGANSQWMMHTAAPVTVDTTAVSIDMLGGNWVQGISTAVGTMSAPSAFFFLGATLKARLSGIFEVHVDLAWSDDTSADSVTFALVTDTAADGAGAVLASVNKVNHGVIGFGAYGTRGADWESCDTNAGAAITFNGAAFSTAPVTQASEVAATLTGLLTTNGNGQQKFGFHGYVYNAAPTGTTKTPFTVGNQVAFGVSVTASHVITVKSARLTVRELSNQ